MRRVWILLLGVLVACSGSSDDSGDDTTIPPARDGGVAPPRDGGTGLVTLSDGFDGAALDPSWSVIRQDVLNVGVANSQLSMSLNQGALWFNADQGAAVYKDVTGDFKVTATVRARMMSNPMLPPDRFVHLGGLIARNPDSANENYVLVVVGWDEDGLSVESKSTIEGVSNYDGPPWPSGDAELRLCRVAGEFNVYKREVGAPMWQLASTRQRGDLPQTIQVGPAAYAAADPGVTPDLIVYFDEVTFAEVDDVADCTN